MKTENKVHKFLVEKDMAYREPTCYGNTVKNNHPEILPLYNAFKRAVVRGTSRIPLHPVTGREQRLFEHILFTMEDYENMTVSERCLYIERIVRRSKVYRDNLKKFSRERIKRNMENARAEAELKLAIYIAGKK